MGIVVDKIKKWIYCKKHQGNITLSTRRLAQILADGLHSSPYRDPFVIFCKGCGKYYVVKRWNKFGKRMRKECY